jgi:tetratricopeptide (TPR) repeat protein
MLRDLEAGRAAAPASAAKRTVSIVLPLPVTRRSRLAAGAVVAAALLVAVPVTWRYVAAPVETTATAPVPATRHLAVLPFTVVGDESLRHIAAGVEEALSTKLFQIASVNVASAAAVERAAAKDSMAAIARDLGVEYLISGTVQGTAAGFRVSVGVHDASGEKQIWADEFSGVAGDLLAIEDQIYAKLLTALDVAPTSAEQARALSHATENIDAYQAYLRGRNAMRGQQDLKNVGAAIAFYDEALKHDPRFARAFAGKADSALRMFRATKESAWAEDALAAAQQAQALDPNLLEVHLALGSIYQATGKTTEALVELATAAQLAPSSDDVFRRLGRAYLASGRGEEAMAAYERAIEINPYYWVSHNAIAIAHVQLGAFDKAAEALKKVTELEPTNVSGHNDLGAVSLQLGRFDEAASAFQRALALEPRAQTYTNLGIAYAYAGKYGEAIVESLKAVDLEPNADQWRGNLGDAYRWAGQTDKAVEAYDKAIELALKALAVNSRDAMTRGNLATYQAKKGETAEGRRTIAAARAIDAANVNLMYFEAMIETLAGRKVEALAALESALEAGYPFSAVEHDPDLRILAGEGRFKELAATYAAN